jgi:hypothetical protein
LVVGLAFGGGGSAELAEAGADGAAGDDRDLDVTLFQRDDLLGDGGEEGVVELALLVGQELAAELDDEAFDVGEVLAAVVGHGRGALSARRGCCLAGGVKREDVKREDHGGG